EKDGLSEVLQFKSEKSKQAKAGIQSIPNIAGIDDYNLEDQVVYDLIKKKAYPLKRLVLLTDYRYGTDQFITELPFCNLSTLPPLPNVIYVGCGTTVAPTATSSAAVSKAHAVGRQTAAAAAHVTNTNVAGPFTQGFYSILRSYKISIRQRTKSDCSYWRY
ncbi:MAG: hypothetical protein EZS28_021504, partial [Streblomastix strix]